MVLNISPLNFLQETQTQTTKGKILSFLTLFIIAVVGVVIVYFFLTNYFSPFYARNELKEGLVGEPKFINPLFSQENEIDQTICHLIFNGLVKYDFEKQQFVGDLAEKFEIEEDGKIYHFWLRDDVYFHDNEKLNMDDILFTYEIIQHPYYHGFWKDAFTNVKIEKINDRELEMTLEKPLSSFLEHNTVGIIPKHLFKDIDDALRPDNVFNVSPTGSGQFAYVKKELRSVENKVSSLSLKNINSQATLKKIRFVFFDNEESLLNGYKMGQIDSFGTLSSQNKETLKEWGNYQLFTVPLRQRYYALFFNMKSDKKISEFNLREALSQALDKQQLTNSLFPEENILLMNGPLESSSWGYDSDIKTYPYDLEKAKDLIKDIPSTELEFTLTYPDTETNKQTADYMKEAWANIGVKINLKSVALYNLRDEVIGPRNFDILLLGQEMAHDPDRYPFWHSTQIDYPGLNISQFRDRFTDKALEQGRLKLNQDNRKNAYKDFQRYFQNEIPATTLYQPNYYYFISRRFADKLKIDKIGIPADRFNSLLTN